jgi:hypothetical protein
MKNNNYSNYKKYRKYMVINLLPDIIFDKKKEPNKKITIAIIIPHRNRISYLNNLLDTINKLKKKDNHNFDLYIIDQNNYDKFSRGMLLNIGFYIANKNYDYDRYIFHDVDSYPSQELYDLYFSFLDYNIHYASPNLEYKYNYDAFVGGVIGINGNDYKKVNGFSNIFFGWGGEDDSFYNRMVINNIKIFRPSKGSYILEKHDEPMKNELNLKKQINILNDLKNWQRDGLIQVDSYFINYKYFELDFFLKTYEQRETNIQNNSNLLYKYQKNKKLINTYKIDYLAQHDKKYDLLLPKNYVINKINAKLKNIGNVYFQHPIKPKYISIIEPLIFWNEIKEKIIDTYTLPKKFINNIETNKRTEKINNILKDEFKFYKNNLTIIDLENTLKFIYDTYSEIIFIRIRNNQIECSYHIYSDSIKIDWYENLKYNNKTIDESVVNILEDSQKKYYTIRNPHYEPANNCLLGFDSYNYFEGNPTSYVSEFIEMIKYTIKKFKNVPDCDLLINRKDFAYLRKDNKYSYEHLFDKKIENPLEKYWVIGCQSKKNINLDIPIPSADEWNSLKNNNKFNTNWNDKKSIAIFRGSSTGCGINENNNMRIKLANKSYKNKENILDVSLTKLVGKIKAYKSNINILNFNKYKYLIGSFLDGKEQSKYKYIFNIEGNAQAYRYSNEFRKKSVILNIKSNFYMWFEPLLKNNRHYIEINSDLSNVETVIKDLINNDKKAKKISINGYRFAQKYIRKKIISTYWLYFMFYSNKLNFE